MKFTLPLVGIILAGCGLMAYGKPISVKPTVFSPENGPDFVPALRLTSQKDWEWEFNRPDRYRYLGYEFKSTVSTEPRYNDEPTSLDVKAGLKWRIDPVSRPVQSFGQRNTSGPQGASGRSTRGFRWGSISTELAFAFEGDEPMRNRQWAYGGKLNYSPAYDRDESQWWIPYLWLDYRRVSELGSTVAEKLGVPRQDYWRFGSQVYWQVPLSPWLGRDTFWGNLTLVPGLQYYRSTDHGLGLDGGDMADAYCYSFAFDYSVPETFSWAGKVPGIRIQVVDGRVPPAIENRTTVSIAITVKWEALFK